MRPMIPTRGGSFSYSGRYSALSGPPEANAPLVRLSTATPPQYIQKNVFVMPTGHSTGFQFTSHYFVPPTRR